MSRAGRPPLALYNSLTRLLSTTSQQQFSFGTSQHSTASETQGTKVRTKAVSKRDCDGGRG
jgi:hypothetical protein